MQLSVFAVLALVGAAVASPLAPVELEERVRNLTQNQQPGPPY